MPRKIIIHHEIQYVFCRQLHAESIDLWVKTLTSVGKPLSLLAFHFVLRECLKLASSMQYMSTNDSLNMCVIRMAY